MQQAQPAAEAARWAESPHPRSDCAADPHLDGMQECILATDRYFAVIEPDGARLAYFFAGSDQLVGPTWQFTAGVSDPRAKTFNLDEYGLAVDYEGALPARSYLALTVSPQARLRPGWLSSYQWIQVDGVARWGPAQVLGIDQAFLKVGVWGVIERQSRPITPQIRLPSHPGGQSARL